MAKIDYRKALGNLYTASANAVTTVDVPEMPFLMADGCGDPNTSPDFHHAVEALFGVSYTLKFLIKQEQGIDYGVLPLEGLWWCDDMAAFSMDDKSNWRFTLMIMQPEHVTAELVSRALAKVAAKGAVLPSTLRFARYHEGLSAQILHVGPFSEEGPTVARLHAYIRDNGYALRGKHHEIYLSDTRRAAPERWKTMLRQPVA